MVNRFYVPVTAMPNLSSTAASLRIPRVEDFEDAIGEPLGVGAVGWGGEVEIELVLVGVADELPVVGERAAVVVAEVVEHHDPRLADDRGPLEQLDEVRRRESEGYSSVAAERLSVPDRHGRRWSASRDCNRANRAGSIVPITPETSFGSVEWR